MLAPKVRRTIMQILPFGLMWMVFGVIFNLIEKGLLGDSKFYPSTGNPYDFHQNLLFGMVSTTITGLLLGTFEVLYLKRWFVDRSLGKKIIVKALIYAVVIFLFLVLTTLFRLTSDFQTDIFDPRVHENLWNFVTNFAFWSIEIYIAVLIVVMLFYSELSDHLGMGVLNNFFIGKYHQPIEEERIFMFCDMKSSTTIAEQLGHLRFFELLRDYYADISPITVDYEGDIYMYVGDEIIVSWKMKDGLRNNNCLECFFAMKNALQNQREKYEREYDVIPSFKAGFHFGKVTAGEIGVIKKDIMFTGDVLNTTARIQGLCNDLDRDLLVSKELMNQLNLDGKYQVESLGESELRGRGEKVELFSVVSLSMQ